jgi:TPR repeat protein/DNA-binding XRE family transcriptional regulator
MQTPDGSFTTNGEVVKTHRISKGLSQEQLRQAAEVSLKTISRMENGESVSITSIGLVAKSLGVKPVDLVCDEQKVLFQLPGIAHNTLKLEPEQSLADVGVHQTDKSPSGNFNLNSALELFRREDYSGSLRIFLSLAETGNTVAYNHLGWMHQHGFGVPPEHKKAAEYYRLAADLGDTNGQSNLGWMYEHGLGVHKDFQIARELYMKAAKQGDGLSMNQLGWMAQNGLGSSSDPSEAFRWYKLAAEAGNPNGYNNLGWMYEFGLGVERNLLEAVKCYRRAVESGNLNGQSNLARVSSLLLSS